MLRGAASVSTMGAADVAAPTPYSEVAAVQYMVAPTLLTKSVSWPGGRVVVGEEDGDELGAASTGPLRSTTCGGAGCGAG